MASGIVGSSSSADSFPPAVSVVERPVVVMTPGWCMVTFLLGTVLHLFAYQSFEPLAAAALAYAFGLALAWLSSRQHAALQTAVFTRLFAIGWLMAGIGGIFAEVFRDHLQLASDASTFYELASTDTMGVPLEDVRLMTESAGAIVTWRAAYNLFASMGFEKGRYIGLLVNILVVAFSGLLAIRATLLIYGFDVPRLRRMQIMVSCCGLFWLFSGVHLRDCFALLVTTISFYVWLRFLTAPTFGRLILYVALSIPLYGGFVLLRAEFVFIPALLTIAALAAVGWTRGRHSPVLALVLILASLIVAGGSWWLLGEQFLFVFEGGTRNYVELASTESSADSLGMMLIMQQPAPIRLVLGSAQLFTFPIPFWAGMVTGSAAAFFKSLNAIFFYALTPMIALAAWRVLSQRALRTPISLFLLITFAACTAAIALTSLETRHFGAFLVPGFCLALIPAIDSRRDRAAFRLLLTLFLLAVTAVHLAWIVIKLL